MESFDITQFKAKIEKRKPSDRILLISTNIKYDQQTAVIIFIGKYDQGKHMALLHLDETGEEIKLNLENLNDNEYDIKDIEDVLNPDLEIISTDFNNNTQITIGEHKYTRELSNFEKFWTYEQTKNSLIDTLIENTMKKNKDKINTYDAQSQKAEKILDVILNYSPKSSDYKPLIDSFIKTDYSYICKPIVDDKKKIYTESNHLLNPEGETREFNNTIFQSFDFEQIMEFELYKELINKNINYNQYRQLLHSSFEIQIEDDTKSICHVEKPYINSNPEDINGLVYISSEVNSTEYVIRNCLPGGDETMCDNLNILNKSKNDNIDKNCSFDIRATNNLEYRFIDNLTDRLITDRTSRKTAGLTVCNGTGSASDIFYSGAADKKDHKTMEYNRSLLIPPTKEKILDGENLSVVGVMLKSVGDYQPQFINTKSEINNGTIEANGYNTIESYNLLQNIGYTLIDQINFNNYNIYNTSSKLHTNYHIFEEIPSNTNIDYYKNNFIFFNKYKKGIIEDIVPYLNSIIPDTYDIFNTIEKESLEKCDNFSDINQVLNKYGLLVQNIPSDVVKKINIRKLLLNRRKQYLDSVLYTNLLRKQLKDQYHVSNDIAKSIISLITASDIDLRNNSSRTFNKEIYQNLIIEKCYNKALDIFSAQYSIEDLEHFITNRLKIVWKYKQETSDNYSQILRLIIENIVINHSYIQFNTTNQLYNQLILYTPIKEDIDLFYSILKLYNIQSYNPNNTVSIDSSKLVINDLKTIDLICKIKDSFDNGHLVYLFFNNLEIKTTIKEFEYQLQEYGKNNYINNGQDERAWENLDNTTKKIHIPRTSILLDKLDVIEREFLRQKKLYSFYSTRCECFEIVKVYRSVDNLINDNREDVIYYDKTFDTTEIDLGYSGDILDNYNKTHTYNPTATINDSIMQELLLDNFYIRYPFSTDQEIIAKIKNMIYHFNNNGSNNQRPIQNGSYALLYTSEKRVLYKYTRGVWLSLGKHDVLNQNICLFEKDQLNEVLSLDFDYLIDRGVDVLTDDRSEHKLNNEESKCIEFIDESSVKRCIPRKFIKYLYEVRKIKTLSEDLQRLTNAINELYLKLEKNNEYIENNIYTQNQIKESEYRKNNTPLSKMKLQKPTIPSHLWNKFKTAYNIRDADIRLVELKEIISEYGVLSKPIKDGSELDIDDNIYWNYPGVNEVMCCKHHLQLIDMAWKDNATRSEILENTKRDFTKKHIIEDGKILCDNCGEILDTEVATSFEGFSNDKPVTFRESVYENLNPIIYTDNHKDIQDLLHLYTSNIGVTLTETDEEFIIVNSANLIQTMKISIYQYLNGETRKLDIPNNKVFNEKSEGVAILDKIGRDRYMTYMETTGNIINIDSLMSMKVSDKKSFEAGFKSKIYPYYIGYCSAQIISIILCYLMYTILYSIPSYKIQGTGSERFAKIIFNGIDETNEDVTLQFLIQEVTNNFIMKNSTSSFINWSAIRGTYAKGEGLKDNELYKLFLERHFISVREEVLLNDELREKKLQKDAYIDDLNINIQSASIEENNWLEFRPPINVIYDYTTNALDQIDINMAQFTQNIVDNNMPKAIINRNNIIENSRILGYKFISVINKKIFSLFPTISGINSLSYTSVCCPAKITSDYLDFFLQDPECGTEISQLYEKLGSTNTFINSKSHSNLEKILTFNNYNTNATKNSYRRLLDYMYLTPDMFPNVESYKLYLRSQFKEINYITITDIFKEQVSDFLIGKQRIWKTINDADFSLLDKIYTEQAHKEMNKLDDHQIVELLTEKLNIMYPDFDADYISRKVIHITLYHGVVMLDIISGQYNYELDEHLDDFFKANENIENQLDKLYLQTNMENALYINTNSKTQVLETNFIDKFYSEQYESMINLYSLLVNIFSDLYDPSYQYSLSELIDELKTRVAELFQNDKLKYNIPEREFIDKINILYNKYFNINIPTFEEHSTDIEVILSKRFLVLHNSCSNLFNSSTNKISKLTESAILERMRDIANYSDIREEEMKFITSRLIIEQYTEDKAMMVLEQQFRQNQLTNKIVSKKINDINKYSKIILNAIASVYNIISKQVNADTVNVNTTFREVFNNTIKNNKNKKKTSVRNIYTVKPYWLDKPNYEYKHACLCPFPNNYLNSSVFESIYYDNYYLLYDDLTTTLSSARIEDKEDLLTKLESIISKSEQILEIVSLIVSKNTQYDCDHNVKLIPILNGSGILKISKYLFYSLCNFIFGENIDIIDPNNLQNNSLENTVKLTLYNIVFIKNIFNIDEFNRHTDDEISSTIIKYKTDQNSKRKKNRDDMAQEERTVHKLFRKLNLGNLFGAYDEVDEVNTLDISTEEAYNDSGNHVHLNIENQDLEDKHGEDLGEFIENNEIELENVHITTGFGWGEDDGNLDEGDTHETF